MSELDLTRLSPKEAAVALRSYPRRYRELLQPVAGDDNAEELAQRVGPTGRSSIDILSDVTRTFVLLGEALRQITINPTPIVHAAVVDPNQRQWDAPPPDRLDEALALFRDEATALADAVDRVPTEAWTRSGNAAGGEAVTALDVVRDAVRTGHAGLVDVEATLRAVRS
jgi:hypothetical protein